MIVQHIYLIPNKVCESVILSLLKTWWAHFTTVCSLQAIWTQQCIRPTSVSSIGNFPLCTHLDILALKISLPVIFNACIDMNVTEVLWIHQKEIKTLFVLYFSEYYLKRVLSNISCSFSFSFTKFWGRGLWRCSYLALYSLPFLPKTRRSWSFKLESYCQVQSYYFSTIQVWNKSVHIFPDAGQCYRYIVLSHEY